MLLLSKAFCEDSLQASLLRSANESCRRVFQFFFNHGVPQSSIPSSFHFLNRTLTIVSASSSLLFGLLPVAPLVGLSWHHHQYFIVGDSLKITFCVVGNPSFSFHLSRNENLMVSRSECWRLAKLPDPKSTPELASLLQTVLPLPILRFLISSFMTVSSCSHFLRSLYRLFFVSETFDPFSQTSPLSLHDLRRLFL